MDTQDPGIEQTGSITSDTNDLSSTASRADDLDHDGLNVSQLYQDVQYHISV